MFQKWLPDAGALRRHRVLRWLAPAVAHPRLWHINRRGVAMGLAVGVFIGCVIPMGLQIVAAAVAVAAVRANLPAAMLSSLITNPFTVAPVYFVAYKLGDLILGPAAELQHAAETGRTLVEGALAMGKPLLVGLTVLGTVLGLLLYLSTMLAWRWHIAAAWRRRGQRRLAKV